MEFTTEELEEFKVEATDLLDSSENELLSLEQDGLFKSRYNSIFRVFHSLKGGASMLGLKALQNHMHSLENIFSTLKDENTLDKAGVSFFLKGIDVARRILNSEEVEFSYDFNKKTEQVETTLRKHVPHVTRPMVYAIDDEPGILDLIETILNNANLDCKKFQDSEEGLAAIKKNPPSLVLIDMKMPKMDGLQILKELRKHNLELPVIVVSGFLEKDILIDFINNGLYAAIEKPFRSQALLSHIFSAIRFQELSKLFARSVNLLIYQFSDLDGFLEKTGRDDIRKTIRTEMELLMESRKKLKSLL